MAFILWLITSRRSEEGSATSHRLKWGFLPRNEVGRITQPVRNGIRRKEEKDGWHLILTAMYKENCMYDAKEVKIIRKSDIILIFQFKLGDFL